jgi:hypothetical protein
LHCVWPEIDPVTASHVGRFNKGNFKKAEGEIARDMRLHAISDQG